MEDVGFSFSLGFAVKRACAAHAVWKKVSFTYVGCANVVFFFVRQQKATYSVEWTVLPNHDGHTKPMSRAFFFTSGLLWDKTHVSLCCRILGALAERTDVNGAFRLTTLPPEAHTVLCSCQGQHKILCSYRSQFAHKWTKIRPVQLGAAKF